jgi:hypothetical protein
VLDKFEPLYTVAHVLAEVSNLTDLRGPERLLARRVLKETVSLLKEAEMPVRERQRIGSTKTLGLSTRRLGR